MEDEQVEPTPPAPEPGPVVSGAAYGLLFVLGVVYGVVAGLQHAWQPAGVAPLVPVLLAAALFGLLYGAGRLMGTKLAPFVTGSGWMLASLAFSVMRPEGDLVVAADASGYWYLGCGALAMVAAVLLTPSSGSWLLRERPLGRSSIGFSDGNPA
ncbi:hypothetical protein Sru01_51520 [Sphaerisporangium rufum]|uniref:Integral membrane protein n=1 Tax=Sphaerisporangium rufum TaxID=1381558 RepID=A0A919R8J8_9ACTN|nr:DUF6113 family protein [Sphaerisporangium rufum]GII80170.1 hypothetical protein Sru01_51520 [Sphaerisporangium rufum]